MPHDPAPSADQPHTSKQRAMIDCYSCQHNQQPSATLPARERVFDDGSWRIAHAISSALPGWMVVVPRRHVLSMAELTAHEAATLGPLLVALSRALHRGLGARKTYLALFAEAEGFQHLHVHLVPRMEDLPPDRRGPEVFSYPAQPADQWVSPDEMDRIAEQLGPLVTTELHALHDSHGS